jgi:hypothetical protein
MQGVVYPLELLVPPPRRGRPAVLHGPPSGRAGRPRRRPRGGGPLPKVGYGRVNRTHGSRPAVGVIGEGAGGHPAGPGSFLYPVKD